MMEELLKALVVWWLLRTGRIGFMVEGAIYGFAVGAGFAVAENIVYLHYLGPATIVIWLIRGFGTSSDARRRHCHRGNHGSQPGSPRQIRQGAWARGRMGDRLAGAYPLQLSVAAHRRLPRDWC